MLLMPSSPSPEQLFEEASAWLARLEAGDATALERERFAVWLARSPAHAKAWQEARELLSALELPARSVRRRAGAVRTMRRRVGAAQPARQRQKAHHPLPRFARAAAGLALAAALVALWQPPLLDDWRSDYHTAWGEQRRISLADGSQILLNTDSAVAVDLAGSERRVRLLRGEAFFQVAHAPERPFWVEAGLARARVTGTAFSVDKAGDEVLVTVAEGRVETSAAVSAAAPVPLLPGQSISYLGNHRQEVRTVDVARSLAWRQGRLVFIQEPLSRVVEQINRYRPGRLVIIDPALNDRPVTAVFSLERLEDAVEALEQSIGAPARRLTGYLVFLG
jgi:transmembrane sensor